MNENDLGNFRNEFEAMKEQVFEQCVDGSCDLEQEDEDYPDYLKAIYAEIMPPAKSGVYFSRWDLKKMALGVDESFAIDVRERMFKNFMQWIADPNDMQKVIALFSDLMDRKCELYKEYSQKYPSTKESFDRKIQKVEKSKAYLNKVYVEFFT
jgi:hypothetical protein